MDVEQKRIFREAFVVWAALLFVFKVFFSLQSIPWIDENLSLIMAVGLLYVPLGLAFKGREKITFVDYSLQDFTASLKLFGVFSVIVALPILAGNHLYQYLLGNAYHAQAFGGWAKLLLMEVALVALPEEFFFRGYFQSKLNAVFGRPFNLFGVRVGWALPLTSLVFALSHSILFYQWWHIFIFFPALAFGWLFEKRGTITAAVLFHALCNLFSQWVGTHYY